MLAIFRILGSCFLFHEFMVGIRYDHTVIVDYLISKSTGTLCLCYLLRILRVLCDTWPSSTVSSIDIGSAQITGISNYMSQLENLKRQIEKRN